MSVLTKAENYRRWTSGRFGNRLRAWRTVDAWNLDRRHGGFSGQVSLRYLGLGGGGWCAYDVEAQEVPRVVAEWEEQGADARLIMVNESAPDASILIQGEFLNAVRDHVWVEGFTYSRKRLKMRQALQLDRQYASGRWARYLLRAEMSPSSWSDFEELLALYPGHVLEVSVYGRPLGDTPGRNALVWEVRKY